MPLLSAGNWGGMGAPARQHPRIRTGGISRKCLEMHNETNWSLLYAKYGQELQKRFFGHFLKGENTGWSNQPRV